jgi:hypothetical protein
VEQPLEKLALTLCEFATIHADGTFTIVRGGIEHWTTTLPLSMSIALLVEVSPGTIVPGNHPLMAVLSNATGMAIARVDGLVTVHHAELATRFTLPVQASIQSYGECTIVCSVGSLNGQTSIDIRPPAGQVTEAT